MGAAVTRKMSSQGKLNWWIVCWTKWLILYIKINNLKIFRNQILRNRKYAANTNIFEKVAEEMNERPAADGRKNTITHSQVRNKFKKLIYECKSISLTHRTAREINCCQVEKGYGKR